MLRTRRASSLLGVALMLGCTPGPAGKPPTSAQPQFASHSVCLPPYWGGLLAGVSTDSEVVRLFGKGRLFEDRGTNGRRYFTDRSKSSTLRIDFGTDRIVAVVELREGLDEAISPEIADEIVSEWVEPAHGVGAWWDLHLGDSDAAVRKNLGDPAEVRQEGPEAVWTHNSTCACELGTGLSFNFRNGRLVAFSVWALMG